MPYAAETTVTVDKSEAELKQLLRKHGANRMSTGYDERQGLAIVMFELGEQEKGTHRMVRLQVNIPSIDSLEKTTKKPKGWWRFDRAQMDEWLHKQRAQVERQRWRALVLLCKAKLESIEQGMSTMEREFLADLVLPGGGTVYEVAEQAIAHAYVTGELPPLLPGAVEAAVPKFRTRPPRSV